MADLSEQAQETRGRILKAAEELFSEKGFDGTSVSEIADKAGVNKPLIYYYFQNKRAVLDSLKGTLLEELRQASLAWIEKNYELVEAGKIEIQQDKLRPIAMTQEEIEQLVQESVHTLVDFCLERRKTLHIMAIESLKKGPNSSLLFQIADLLSESLWPSFLQQKGVPVSRLSLVDSFFLEVMPALSFALYCDQWSERYGMPHEEVKAEFIQSFQEAKRAYMILASEE